MRFYTLYESTFLRSGRSVDDEIQFFKSSEPLSTEIVHLSRQIVLGENVNYATLSPYVPYSLYQSAVVQFRLWKRSNDGTYKEGFDSLTDILVHY